jgi:predicted aspartyl protease
MPLILPRRALAAVVAVCAAICLMPHAAHAAITPEAAKVVARYLEVTGGAAAFAAESTSYTHAKVLGFGFTGTYESWAARPSRQYSRTALGPFELAEGDDGQTPWRTDPTTGRIVKLADQDLQDARESNWFGLERWADADQGGGKVELSGAERDSSGLCSVLAVAAPGADKPRRLWFLDASGLLVREEAPRDNGTVLTTFSAWRKVAGRLRPMQTRTGISSMPANVLTQQVDSIAVNIPVTGVAFSMPDTAHANALAWLKTPGTATLPFEYRARHVWLRASIGGSPPEDFLFDTGASVTVLDSTFAATHGIRTEGYMQAAGAGASGSASFTTLPALRIAGTDGDGVELRDLKVAVMSVNPQFSRYFWRNMAGVIGYDVISRFTTEIDYDHGVLVLHDPAQWRYHGAQPAVAMVMNGTVPAIRGTIDGLGGLFRLDVGSSSTVDVHTPFVAAHGLEKKLRHPIEVSGAGFGGEFSSLLGRLSRMSLGGRTWDEPMVILSRAREGAFASDEFAGNVGNRTLERFKVTLDYEHREVALDPGARFHQRDTFTHSGALLGWFGDHVEALSVLPHSPAERAGLREGDRVVSVGGKPALEMGLTAVEQLLDEGREGSTVAVEVLRDGAKKTLRVKVQEMLP